MPLASCRCIIACVVGIVVICPAVRSQDTCRLTRRETSAEFSEALKRAGERLSVKDVVEFKGYSISDVLVEWQVYYDQGRLWQHLDDTGFRPELERPERWLAWFSESNQALLDATAKAASGLPESIKLNLETDVSADFCPGDLQERFFCTACTFTGSRVTYIKAPPASLSFAAEEKNLKGVQLQVRILPEKRAWQHRESISGKLEWRNIGQTRVSIRPIEMPNVTVEDEHSNSPTTFNAKMFICGTPVASLPPITLEPGQIHVTGFSVETDPLALAGGVLMPPGLYRLVFPDLLRTHNIPTVTEPVAVTVRGDPDGEPPPRVLSFSAGANRLVVAREDGAVEAYDLQTGECVSRGVLPDFVAQASWEHTHEFSPDGIYVAVLRKSAGYASEYRPLELFDLNDAEEQPRSMSLPATPYSSDRWRLLRFSADSKSLFVQSRQRVLEIDCRTAEIAWQTETTRHWDVSPDGQYVIEWPDTRYKPKSAETGYVATIRSREGNQAAEIKLPGRDSLWDRLLGQRGVYVQWDPVGDGETLYYGYDGQKKRSFPGEAGRAVCESLDGTLVAFDAGPWPNLGHKPNKIGVWKTDGTGPLWQLADDSHRVACFTGDSSLLVVGIMDPRALLRVTSFHHTFEVYQACTGELVKSLTLSAR